MIGLTQDTRAEKEAYRTTLLGALAQHCGGEYYGGYHFMTDWTMLLSSEADDPSEDIVRVHIAPKAMPGEMVRGTHEDLRWRSADGDPALAASRLSIGRFRRFYPPFM